MFRAIAVAIAIEWLSLITGCASGIPSGSGAMQREPPRILSLRGTLISPAPPPVIRRLVLPPGTVTLDISNPSGQPYNVQFSRDRIAWNTVASKQTTAQWTAPFAAGDGGYFRLSQSY